MDKLYLNIRQIAKKLLGKITLLLLFFHYSNIYAQRGDCHEITNQEAIKLYQDACGKPTYKIKEALNLLEKAIQQQSDFVDAYYKYGEICYNYAFKMFEDTVFVSRNDYYSSQAEKNFAKVIELCPSFNYYMAYFYLGQFYYHARKYYEANKYLSTFIGHNNENTDYYEDAKNMLKNVKFYIEMINNPVPFSPKPLLNVCTTDDEYLPLISPDEEILFFSHRFKKNPNTSYEEYVEEMCMSTRVWDDSAKLVFTPGTPLPAPFNDGRNQGGATITIDNNHMFITICEFERAQYTSYKNCDIFTTDNIKGKWSPLRRLGKEINNVSTFEGMPSITADGKVLFFASNREGGYGGLDIYKSVKGKNGEWGKAENLGPVINTSGDDKTPFIHSDSQTLYFSTNGRFGMGGFDIFYSHYLGNGQWTEPKNIGYPINTENDEVGLTVSTNGKQVFFSSREYNKDKNWDIYYASLYEAARPKKVLFVKGKLTDENGKEVTNAHVGLTNVESKEYTEGMVDENSGKYAVAVPLKKSNDDFLLTIKKEDFVFNSKLIDPTKKEYDPPTTVNMKISRLEKNKAIRLENVNFELDSYKLDEISKTNINLLVELMKENPDIKIVLYGYTDNQGTPEYNEELSHKRVKSVRDYMCSQGISSGRVTYKGFGEKRPIASNSTKQGRALNRRVEFIVK